MTNTNISPQNITNVLEVMPINLAHRVIDAGLDAKGSDVSVLDIREVFDIADYFIIFSGRSDRHAQGICNRILEATEKLGITPHAIEGYEQGHWIVIDLNEVVVHIFYAPIREQYDLEGLWIKARKLIVDPKNLRSIDLNAA